MRVDELVVGYNLPGAQQRADAARQRFWSQVWRFGISIAITAVFAIWQSTVLNALTWTILILLMCVPLVFVGIAFFRWRAALADAAAVGDGIALRIGRGGLVVADEVVPWEQVGRLTTRRGGPGRSRLLVVERRGAPERTLPLDLISVGPAQLDNAVRAYSGARLGVDLSALDE